MIFDWEARYARIPAYQYNSCHRIHHQCLVYRVESNLGVERFLKHCISSTNFILEDINRTYDGERNFFFLIHLLIKKLYSMQA